MSDLTISKIEKMIYVIRGQKVMLDSDLAELYGVEVKRLNEQVKRNLVRFPQDFMFQLTEEEYNRLRSQIATFKSSTTSRKYSPYVFTENGVAMLSSILNSAQAIQVHISIMRIFLSYEAFCFLKKILMIEWTSLMQVLVSCLKLFLKDLIRLRNLLLESFHPIVKKLG